MIQKSLLLVGKETLEWNSNELPPLKKDEILIKTIATAISIGSELPQYKETDITDARSIYPRKVGYESYGEIIEMGFDVKSFSIGDKVIAFYGQRNLGIVKEHNAFKVPEEIDYLTALLAILSCDAAKGVLKLNPVEDNKVIVTGMGTIGLLTVYFLRNYCNVKHIDVFEPNNKRWDIAKSFGVNHIFPSTEIAVGYYDYGIECSSQNSAFSILQKSVKSNSEICVLSDGNIEPFTLLPEFHEKELRIIGSSDGWDYKKHSEWFFKTVSVTPYVKNIFQHEIKYDRLIQCFEELRKGEITPIKVSVIY
ncbi:zinc-dependent alcohol dehydrogenase [Bacillus sp. DJP31]|uniref:zinc-dependent alcohol dehydrogenase n=1 Tax=Bacillus sp. DJP31 TaxID=3409789 RepID=UPI003BB768D2